MRSSSTPAPSRLGVATSVAIAVLCIGYGLILSVGLLTLPSPSQPIQDPWFTLMELLILAIAPAMVAFSVALHGWVPDRRKTFAMLCTVFMAMCAAVTSCVHFSVLVLSREPAFSADVWRRLVFSFNWPSVAYALDILAWDVFFPLAAVFAALCIQGSRLQSRIRLLLYASAGFAFAGLLGVPLASMSIRNIGIIGYAVIFPVAAGCMAVVFHRSGEQSAA